MERVPLLIVGGGIVGLSTAVFLRAHGVPAVLVEKHGDTSGLPRTRILSPRTMEIYRGVGLEPVIREAPPSVFARLPVAIRAHTLSDPEIYHTVRPPAASVEPVTPCPPALVDQGTIEPLVRAHAVRTGARLRFGTALTRLELDGDGAVATVEDSGGREYRIRSRYLIAADGHRSTVRAAIGVPTTGPGTLTHVASIPFAADLSAHLAGRPVSLCYLDSPEPGTLLTPYDRDGRWVLTVPYHPERGERAEDFTPERCHRLIDMAVGAPVRVTVPAPTAGRPERVSTWQLASRVARRYRSGPVFLVGDAAHVMPPAGGCGANTGIQDGHNLAWKLAAVLQGEAGAGLLDSYDAERRPTAIATCAVAVRRQELRTGAGDDAELDQVTTALGYRYRSTAVLDGAGDDSGTDFLDPRTAGGQPGTRAPHIRTPRPDGGRPLLDLLDGGWALVCSDRRTPWPAAAVAVAAELGVRVRPLPLPETAARPDGRPWHRAFGVTPDGASLIRPDGFVAWRSARAPADSSAELRQVLRRLLHRGGGTG
jgi:putative polyketide hydroxylase